MPGASLLPPRQRAAGKFLCSLTEKKSQEAIFPIFPLRGGCSRGLHFINPFLSLPPLHNPVQLKLGEQREVAGGAQGTCHVIPGQTLCRGLLAKALCLSDAGARAAGAAPCKLTRCRTPLELPACDWKHSQGQQSSWDGDPILKNTQTLPKSISQRYSQEQGCLVLPPPPQMPCLLNAFAFHYTQRKAQSSLDC